MATIRPKSPRPVAIKGEKDESIWDKLGTLGRKKRIKEGEYYRFACFIFMHCQIAIFGHDCNISVRCGC